jgi:hypothetical protein
MTGWRGQGGAGATLLGVILILAAILTMIIALLLIFVPPPAPRPASNAPTANLPPGGQLFWSGTQAGNPARVIVTLSNGYACLISQTFAAGHWADQEPGHCVPAGDAPTSR